MAGWRGEGSVLILGFPLLYNLRDAHCPPLAGEALQHKRIFKWGWTESTSIQKKFYFGGGLECVKLSPPPFDFCL